MSDKKRIQEQEWSILDHFAEDVNTSLSKVYDVLREGRILRKQDLMNRSWFMGFMRAICGCVDGKMKGYRRPKISDNSKPEVKETSVVKEKPVEQVIEQEVKETSAESMSELLSSDALFVLRWMYQNHKGEFNAMLHAGFSKSKVLRSVKELMDLGIITKKNPRRFDPFNWERILKDFPEVSEQYSPEDEESRKISHRNPEKEIHAAPNQSDMPKSQKPAKKTDMERAIEWLVEDEHAQGEFTKPELINFLKRIHVRDCFGEAEKAIQFWLQENAIAKVPGTFAFKILPLAKLLKVVPADTPEELPRVEVTKQSYQTLSRTQTNIDGKDLIIRCGGKDIRVVNKSDSKLSVTIENGSVILTIS